MEQPFHQGRAEPKGTVLGVPTAEAVLVSVGVMAPPPILYHYTSGSGLIGIVGRLRLWASDVEFLNDAEEVTYGRDTVVHELLRRADELDPSGVGPDTTEGSRATVLRSTANELSRSPDEQQAHVYVSCFCEDGDLLSQWRAYGSDAGYAIGFRSDQLANLEPAASKTVGAPSGPGFEPHLQRVMYGLEEAKSLIDSTLDTVAPEPTGHPGVHGWVRYITVALPLLASVKNDAFAEEREWRLAYVTDVVAGLKFRSGHLGVIPYREFSVPPEAIQEVVVGPGRFPELRFQGVRQLLQSNKLTEVQTVGSRVPLRV
jgi:hypothetical protein